MEARIAEKITVDEASGCWDADDGVIEIELSNGYRSLVDKEDAERVLEHRWYAQKVKNGVYARRDACDGGRRVVVTLHGFILGVPQGTHVDHIDRNGLNNRRENLRECDYSQNNANRKPGRNCKSGYRGVYLNKKSRRYVAHVYKDKKQIKIGEFPTAEEAAIAYDAKAREIHGEFAWQNFKEGVRS